MAGPSKHSSIGASGMHRWANCPGSVKLSEGMPNPSSIYAEEGTKAHDLAAEILEGRLSLNDLKPPEVDADMKGAIKVYVDYNFKLQKERNTEMLVEREFDLSSIFEGCFGTSDCVQYESDTKTLHVIDYKHGAGLAVEVEQNMQLQYYGLGALLSTGYPCDKVVLTIVQPRCEHPDGPVRSWELSSMELLEFSMTLKEAAAATQKEDAPIIPGSWCRFCNAKAICPAFKEKANAMATKVFAHNEPYCPEELSKTLEMIPAIKKWVKAVEDFAYYEATNGRCPPGYKIVNKMARRKWINEIEASKILKEDFGMTREDCVTETLRSVAQIEKLLPKGAKKDEMFTSLFTKDSSGTTLVPESDKRAPAKVTPKDVFKVIEGEDNE